mmetsp:Transcript_26341/g.84382  ORF Transcript_26341/g.84382 Transcript_26341/m.84382 type:complete len:225 (+) Transcript_26341:648-1322(+)
MLFTAWNILLSAIFLAKPARLASAASCIKLLLRAGATSPCTSSYPTEARRKAAEICMEESAGTSMSGTASGLAEVLTLVSVPSAARLVHLVKELCTFMRPATNDSRWVLVRTRWRSSTNTRVSNSSRSREPVLPESQRLKMPSISTGERSVNLVMSCVSCSLVSSPVLSTSYSSNALRMFSHIRAKLASTAWGLLMSTWGMRSPRARRALTEEAFSMYSSRNWK